MLILAEVSDKMPTILQMWLCVGMLSLVFAGIAVMHRWAAAAMVPIAAAASFLFVTGAYHEAYREDSFSQAVWDELGGVWVAHSFTSGLFPVVLVLAVAAIKWWRAGIGSV